MLERYSRLKYRAVDIFMASSEGLVKELESLLDGGESRARWYILQKIYTLSIAYNTYLHGVF